MSINDFHAAMYQAHLLYGIDFKNEDEFEELGLIAYDFIGNKNLKFYRYSADISNIDLSVELPCNCDIIEAVTLCGEDWNQTTNYSIWGDINSLHTEQYIESIKNQQSPFYISGKFAHFERIGNKLYFDQDYGRVNILYRGQVLDDQGLPVLTNKEVNAIAVYCAYVIKYKQGLSTNNPGLIQQAQLLQNDWYRFCDQARTPEHMTQNEMNEILDVKSSFMRKSYGKSFKPIM